MIQIIYNEEDQKFYTIPDGDIATHQQIKKYFENKIKQIPINFKCNNAENNLDRIMEEKLYGRTSI